VPVLGPARPSAGHQCRRPSAGRLSAPHRRRWTRSQCARCLHHLLCGRCKLSSRYCTYSRWDALCLGCQQMKLYLTLEHSIVRFALLWRALSSTPPSPIPGLHPHHQKKKNLQSAIYFALFCIVLLCIASHCIVLYCIVCVLKATQTSALLFTPTPTTAPVIPAPVDPPPTQPVPSVCKPLCIKNSCLPLG
jgi:hypothetical protein